VKSLSTRRRHPLAAFVVLLIALGFAGGLFALFVSPSAANADSGETAAQQIADGQKLYISSCSSCHGLPPTGTNLAPSLIGVGSAAVDFQMSTGRMPAQQIGAQVQSKPNPYTEGQIDDIAAYIQSLGGGPQIPAANLYNPTNSQIALGGVLFRTECTQCHQASGEGGALTSGKYAPSLTGATPQQIYEAMLSGPENMPVFGNSVIPPAQKQAIISYIVSMRGAPNEGGAGLGRLGPVSEGLFVWTVVLAALLLCAVWIAAHTTKASAEKIAQAAAAKKAAK
jgi:ubiquinol-cytochrome c reductase cytochrome c subunit